MPKLSDPTLLNLQQHILLLGYLVKLFISDLVREDDVAYSPETSMLEGTDRIHIAFYHSAVLLRLPYGLEPCKCNTNFPKPCLGTVLLKHVKAWLKPTLHKMRKTVITLPEFG